MRHRNSIRENSLYSKLIAGSVAIVSMVVILSLLSSRPLAASANASSIPSTSDLFDDLSLPYVGLGAVWIRADGLILIEIAGKESVAFWTNVAGLSLVEKDSNVAFFQTPANGTVIHEFAEQPVENPSTCSATFHIAGYLEMDYDGQTGMLDINVDGAKQTFKVKLNFVNVELNPVVEADSNPKGGETAAQSNCSVPNPACECNVGGSWGCTACKACPPYRPQCVCMCQSYSGPHGPTYSCRCSDCTRAGGSGVVVEPVDYQPVDP